MRWRLPSAAAEDSATLFGLQPDQSEPASGRRAERAPGAERNPCRARRRQALAGHSISTARLSGTRCASSGCRTAFLIKREDPRIGILETDWAENRADIPMDPVRKVLSKALDSLYSSPTRDMFRVRLEAGAEPGTTELFLTHRGMQEVFDDKTTVWQPRPADPELESEMLNRLMVYMGVQEQQAKQALQSAEAPAARAQFGMRATPMARRLLNVEEDVSRAWRRAGLALDRVGFSVEDPRPFRRCVLRDL